VNTKNYYSNSKIEAVGHHDEKLAGYSTEQLRQHFKMKPKQVKKRNCLDCEKIFESADFRLCDNCRTRY
jgi:hypothetical protein